MNHKTHTKRRPVDSARRGRHLALAQLCALLLLALSAAASASPEPATEAELLAHVDGHEAATDHGTTHINWWSCAKAKEHGAPLGMVIINFTLLLLLLVRFVRRPLLGFLAERHHTVSADIGEASRLHEAAQQRLDEIESKLQQLDGEIATIRSTAVEQAEQEKRRIIENAEREVEQIIAGADRTMRREVERAKRKLELTAITAGVDAARQLLRTSLSDDDRVRLQREYIDQIRTTGGGS